MITACVGQVGGRGDAGDAGGDATDGASDLAHADGRSPDLALDAGADASPTDVGSDIELDASTCGVAADPTTVALLTFDGVSGTTVAETTGKHPGEVRGSQVTFATGADGCATAAAFAGGTDFIEVADGPAFDLATGAVDLRVRFDAGSSGSYVGVLGRDAYGTDTEGHFSIFRACDGSIIVRHQRAGISYYQCGDPVADGVWVHVGVNFGAGGLEIFVDGKRGTRTDTVKIGGTCQSSATCGSGTALGIDGNDNPWVIGASAAISDEAKATPTQLGLKGAIDQLRISSTRRPFSQGFH